MFVVNDGIFNLSDFIVISKPGEASSIRFSTSAINPSLSDSVGDDVDYFTNITIEVDMRECIMGEVTSRNECVLCEPYSYSYDSSDSECIACPDSAYCYGGIHIAPKARYWRSTNTSTEFWSCPNPEACIGSVTSNYSSVEFSYTGECAEGYKGNKCQSCEFGYSRTAANVCGKCPPAEENIIRLIGITIVSLLFCCYVVRSSLKSAYKPEALHSVYMKILINYFQLVMMTATLDLDWPEYVLELFAVQEAAGSATDQLFSIDCYFEEDRGTEYVFYAKLVLTSILPLIIMVASLVFWLGVSAFHRNYRYLKEEHISTIIVLIFLVQPNIIKVMFGAINCEEIDAGEYWLIVDLDVRCWNSEHSFYAYAIAIPSILIWGIAIPGFCLFLLYRNRKKLHTLRVRKMYGFLFNGYSRREYYWEIVVLYRKICILCCAVIIGSISIPILALSVMLLILTFIFLQTKYTPYMHAKLNRMELKSLLISACTIYCGLYYLTGDLNESWKLFLFLIIVGVNIYFLVVWMSEMFKFGFKALVKYIPCIKRFLPRHFNLRCEMPMIGVENENPHVYEQSGVKMFRLTAETQIEKYTSFTSIESHFNMRDFFLDVVYYQRDGERKFFNASNFEN